MQDRAAGYPPEGDSDAFIDDMLELLDGPEQREVQRAARELASEEHVQIPAVPGGAELVYVPSPECRSERELRHRGACRLILYGFEGSGWGIARMLTWPTPSRRSIPISRAALGVRSITRP
jgi:hypothetical protein